MKSVIFLLAHILLLFPTSACSASKPKISITSTDRSLQFTTGKVVKLDGEVNPDAAAKLAVDIVNKLPLPGPLVILIDSPGGDVGAGLLMIASVEFVKSLKVPVYCVVTGQAASMAANILSYCDVRLATKDSLVMFHHFKSGLQLNIYLTAQQLRAEADSMDEMENPITRNNINKLQILPFIYEFACQEEKYWTVLELLDLKYIAHEVVLAPTP